MKVHVLGSINMDIVAYCERHPAPGETIFGKSLSYFPGGKGANQAVSSAKLGAVTVMRGAVGRDGFGDTLLKFLDECTVDTSEILRVDDSTGVALITVNEAGENSIIIVPGANDHVTYQPTGTAPGSPIVALAQFETPPATTLAFFRDVLAGGGISILNPSPYAPISEELLSSTSVLIVNEVEFSQIAATPLTRDPERIEQCLADLGSRLNDVIVTLGPAGFVMRYSGQISRRGGHNVKAVDTTGAGDCFAGAFAAALAQGRSAEEAATYANAAAALSVTRKGAGPSMPNVSEVALFLTEPNA